MNTVKKIETQSKSSITLRRNNSVANIWNDKLNEIKNLFAPNLSSKEFEFFVELGKQLGANPFLREIWAVKYDKSQPAQIFVGRDFYRKKAQSLPSYDGHIADAVYENDEFSVENGIPIHKYKLTNRGKLIGGYAVVYRKDISHPFFVFVNIDEYNKNQSTWKKMPATMIKKVAEAQALRGAFQGVFAGTYDESESWIDENGNEVIEAKVEKEVIEPQQVEVNENVNEELKTLKNIGLDGEIKDNWIKVLGNTYAHKQILQQLGYTYYPNKKIWAKKLA
jgi:phage recombination protein Bet